MRIYHLFLMLFTTLGVFAGGINPDEITVLNETLLPRYMQRSGEGESFTPLGAMPAVKLSPLSAKATESETMPLQPPVPSNAGQIKSSGLIAKDLNYSGATTCASMTITPKEGEDGKYIITNLYNTATELTATIDLAAGTVQIPAQNITELPTYGTVKFCPMTFQYDDNGNITGMSFTTRGYVYGTIDEKGVIKLAGWALMFTTNPDYANTGLCYVQRSEWQPANLMVKASVTTDKTQTLTYPALVEQTGDNTATFYGLAGINGDILQARLQPDGTVTIAPQHIYTNPSYGPFFIYPASIDAGGRLTVNAKGVLTGKLTENTLTFGNFVVAARQAPSSLVGYDYRSVSATGEHGLTLPQPATLDFPGQGTQDAPYKITSRADIIKLSRLSAQGNDFTGKYFSLESDIDLSGTNRSELMPIGDEGCQFQGHFNGNGHKIIGLELDGMGFANVGFFGVIGHLGSVSNLTFQRAQAFNVGKNLGVVAGVCYGKIDNCHISNAIIRSSGLLMGGIASIAPASDIDGTRYTPEITNCSLTDCEIAGIGSLGGIVGQAAAIIRNCKFTGSISHQGNYGSGSLDAGGIAGALSGATCENCLVGGMITDAYGKASTGGIAARSINSSITGCLNVAMVNAKLLSSDSDTATGGIVGYGSGGSITDCCNAGTVSKSGSSKRTAGILGYLSVSYMPQSGGGLEMTGKVLVTNTLNYGQIIGSNPEGKKGLYGDTYIYDVWRGDAPEDLCFTNCFYDSQIQHVRETKYGRPTSALTGKLPEGFGDRWQAASGQYPMLKAFAGEPLAALAASPLTLAEGSVASKAKVSFKALSNNDVAWKIAYNTDYVNECDILSYDGSTFTIKNRYAVATVMAFTADNRCAKAYHIYLVPKVFEGEGTAQSPYLLKTKADWKTLADAVGSVGQTHAGDFFAMASDIDFDYATDFIGVGGTFAGELDGRNHKISKLRIAATVRKAEGEVDHTYSRPFTGLFSTLDAGGKLKNIIIDKDCQLDFYSYSGAIVGGCRGEVSNCRNYAPFSTSYTYNGGITGLVAQGGKIDGCYNSGDILAGEAYTAGIAGFVNADAKISNSQNDGAIITLGEKINYVGGIAAGSFGTITSCVNNGEITGNAIVGGIAGENNSSYKQGIVKGCVANGLVTCTSKAATQGAIVGASTTGAEISANVYDASINVNGAVNNQSLKGNIALSSASITSGETVGGLSSEIFDFSKGKYPVLKQFASEDACSALRSMVLAVPDGRLRTNLNSTVELRPTSAEFKLVGGKHFRLANNSLEFDKPAEAIIVSDTLTIAYNGLIKSYIIGNVPDIFPGAGTEESPYVLSSPADWNKLADFMQTSRWEFPNSHFRFANDIDFAGDSIRLLGVNGISFAGVLDGNNHALKNYVYYNANSSTGTMEGPNRYPGVNIGLIGTLGTTGVLKNLTLDGVFKGAQLCGGVAGMNYGRIENVTQKGTVAGITGIYVGGFSFRAFPGAVYSNCRFEGKVYCPSIGASGFVYDMLSDTRIENCLSAGEILADARGVYGFAYNCNGVIENSINRSRLTTTTLKGGSAAGFLYELQPNGSLIDCVNESDIDFKDLGTNIYGLFDRAADEHFGVLKGCVNKGRITGKGDVAGIGGSIGAGMKIADCFNHGDITAATGLCAGLFNKVKGVTLNHRDNTVIERCANTGTITAHSQNIGGIASSITNSAVITDCYNSGDVIITDNTGSCFGGVVSSISSSKMLRCFNLGNVSSSGSGVGALAGYVGGDNTSPMLIEDCYNLGDVTSTYELTTNVLGNAGGLVGYFSTYAITMRSCYNMGTVTARRRVGGLAAGMLRPDTEISRCFNAGKVICTGTDPCTVDGVQTEKPLSSATVYTNNVNYTSGGVSTPYLEKSSHLYFDKAVNPEWEFRSFPNSAKSLAELRAITFGDNFVVGEEGYPVLCHFAERYSTADIAVSALGLDTRDENFNEVKYPFSLIAPEGSEWEALDPATGKPSANLVITGITAVPKADGDVILQVKDSKGMQSKRFVLKLAPSLSGVDDLEWDENVPAEYYNLQGVRVASPQPGNIYILKRGADTRKVLVK